VPLDGPGPGANVDLLAFGRTLHVWLDAYQGAIAFFEKTRYSNDSISSNSNRPPCWQSSGGIAASSDRHAGRSSESGFVEHQAVYLEALEAPGYTESEARFLYVVTTHSRYFVARQFLAFTRVIGASTRPLSDASPTLRDTPVPNISQRAGRPITGSLAGCTAKSVERIFVTGGNTNSSECSTLSSRIRSTGT
jgi:hypothetical protein